VLYFVTLTNEVRGRGKDPRKNAPLKIWESGLTAQRNEGGESHSIVIPGDA